MTRKKYFQESAILPKNRFEGMALKCSASDSSNFFALLELQEHLFRISFI